MNKLQKFSCKLKKVHLKKKEKKINKKDEEKLLKSIKEKYNQQTSPYYAASRLWVDSIIDPLSTRKVLSLAIEAANNSPIKEKYNPGIIQS